MTVRIGVVVFLIAATFEVAWRRRDAVPDGEEALPWLLSTARNFARNADRKAHRERTPSTDSRTQPRRGAKPISTSVPNGTASISRSRNCGPLTGT